MRAHASTIDHPEASVSMTGASVFLDPHQTAPAQNAPERPTESDPMADSPSIVSPPYHTVIQGSGDDGDDAFRAALISHAGASVERNQDAQFSAAGQQRLLQDVAQNSKETVQAKFDAERGDRQAERESARQFAELKAELAAIRAEGAQRELSAVRAELAESRADARGDVMTALLTRLVTKLGA